MKAIEKVLKEAISTNKYKSGIKEVSGSVKGSKLLIISRSIPAEHRSKIEDQAKAANIPVYQFAGNSVELGKLCNRPFRITAIAIKTGTNDEIQSILAEAGEKGHASAKGA